MVGKLMKHELIALLRTLIYVGIVVLVLAVLSRICLAVEAMWYWLFLSVSLGMGIFVLCACAFLTSVSRFWTSLFTGQGYMTFSLPATPSQILTAKLLSALVATFFSVIVSVLALLIAFAPDFSVLFDGDVEIGAIIDTMMVYLSSDPLSAVEGVLYLITALPMALLFIYLAMSVGQLFTKGRKGITFLIMIGGYWLISMINMLAFAPLMDTISELVGYHATQWIEIAVNIALDVGMFCLIRFILLRKVNLIV